MLRRVLDILTCPLCHQPLKVSVHHEKKVKRTARSYPGCKNYCELLSLQISSPSLRTSIHSHCSQCYQLEIAKGLLACRNGHIFAIDKSIPRLQGVIEERQRTKRTFDIEWKVFNYNEKIYGHTQEEELRDLFHRMVVDENFLHGKTVLDAGCGNGRLTLSVGHFAKEVLGIDFSRGVDEAHLLTEKWPTIHILQGDLMKLPFRDSSFDYVYSKGVLHYVPNVKKCLAGLASVVESDGALSVTLYPRMSPTFEAFTDLIRRATVRLPIRLNYGLSHVLIPFLSLAWKWSGLKRREIDWNERAHMIFNWLSSEFQNRASTKEVTAWFEELGFKHMKRSSIAVGVTGSKLDPNVGKTL